jgi:hypothetical protein
MKNFEQLNINDLDVQELENRLEMSVMEASAAGWINTDPKPYPLPPNPHPCTPGPDCQNPVPPTEI